MTRPRLVGDGPVTCSTSLEIERVPTIIFDTNRYYADLGVDYRATRAEIRAAYLARGQHSVRLTFVVKQLLNPVVRRAYDMTPLGHIFVDDEIRDQVRRVAALRLSDLAGRFPSLDEADVPTVVDTTRVPVQSPHRFTWPYAYYLWDVDHPNEDRLRRWQELLTVALGREKEHLQIAVGLIGSMAQPVEIHRVGYRVVAFLRDGEGPTDALAQRAVSQLRQREIELCQVSSARAQKPRRKPARAAARSPRPTTSASTATPSPLTTQPSSGS